MIETEIITNSDIYVPIDSSIAKEAIPVGEDILYSSLCKIAIEKIAGYSSRSGPHYKVNTFESHMLLTRKGLATVQFQRKKDKGADAIYLPWHTFHMILRLPSHLVYNAQTKIFLRRDKNYESKENFKKRKKEFFNKFAPIIYEAKSERLLYIQENRNNKEIYSKKEEKFLQKFIKKYGKYVARLDKKKK